VVAQFHALGVPVRTVAPHAAQLFDACAGAWFGLEEKVLVFDGEALEVIVTAEGSNLTARPRVLVPLRPLIRELRQRLSEEDSGATQPEISFPLVGLPQERSA
jgi:hypothetical protein